MNHDAQTSRSINLVTLALAAVWIAAAAWRPDSTYHLAPILVVGVGPVLMWGSPLAVARATAFGAVVAAGGSLLLTALDLLRGPSLLPFGGALVEALVFAGASAAAILVAASLPARRSVH